MHGNQQSYDQASTVFSPDGRLFQVEYAREAVKRGTTAVGLKYKDGVLLIIDKRISSRLVEARSVEKIFRIDGHAGCATSGLVADARVLVDRARLSAQMHKITYNEQIPVDVLVKDICDLMQNYTQYGGIRPLGTSMLVAGVDGRGIHLYETDPSGALMAYKAAAIGAGRNAAMAVFEEKYKEGLTLEGAIALGMEAMRKAGEGETKPETVEIGLIQSGEGFRKMEPEDVASRLGKGK
jgi:proteasome alpha subunit